MERRSPITETDAPAPARPLNIDLMKLVFKVGVVVVVLIFILAFSPRVTAAAISGELLLMLT